MRARSAVRSSLGSLGRRSAALALAVTAAASLASCTLEPDDTVRELSSLRMAGGIWIEQRSPASLPLLPAEPTLDEIVARALLANHDLEARWHAWRAALENVFVVAGWPNTDLTLELTSFFVGSGGWDSAAVTLGFDPMDMLQLPNKARSAGRIAYEEALAAGRRFEERRLALRAEAFAAASDWALLAERLAVEEERVALLASLERQGRMATSVGRPQQELLQQQVDLEQARLALEELRAEVPARRAALNALIGRDPLTPLPLPRSLPEPRPLPLDDEAILLAGVSHNRELAALEHEAAARGEALHLARLGWLPNVAPTAQAGGSIDESLSLMFTMPITIPSVRAAIRRAEADLRASQARVSQQRLDAGSELVGALASLRWEERRLAVLGEAIEPAARALVSNQRLAYTTGSASLSDLVGAQRLALDLRLDLAEARVAREQRLHELERAAGLDLRRLINSIGAAPARRAPEDDS